MIALVEIIKACLFVGVIGGTAFYWGRQIGRRNRLTVQQIQTLRACIEGSFSARFSGQFTQQAEFQELVDRRLEILLRFSKSPLAYNWNVARAAYTGRAAYTPANETITRRTEPPPVKA